MSLAPAPILHNGVLNTTFNASDFNNASKLNSTNVTGPLTVSGLATFNSGTQVNGTQNVTGAVVCNTSTVNSNQTVGGTSVITGLTTCTGGLTLGTSSTFTLPSTQAINSSVTLLDTSTAQTITGLKTLSNLLTCNGGLTIGSNNNITLSSTLTTAPSSGVHLGGITSFSFSSVSLANNTTSTQSITVPNNGIYILTGYVNYVNTSATTMNGSYFSQTTYCNVTNYSIDGGQFNYTFLQNQSLNSNTTQIINTIASGSKTMGISIYAFYTSGSMVLSGTINAIRIA